MYMQLFRGADKILHSQCEQSELRKGIRAVDGSRNATLIGFASYESNEEGQCLLEVYTQNYAYVLRCKDRKQELHDL